MSDDDIRGDRDDIAMDALEEQYWERVRAELLEDEYGSPAWASTPRAEELASMRYEDYLQTPEWHAQRERALDWAGHRCQVCGSQRGLDVHHNTYERLGYERLQDLFVLCRQHHQLFHTFDELLRRAHPRRN